MTEFAQHSDLTESSDAGKLGLEDVGHFLQSRLFTSVYVANGPAVVNSKEACVKRRVTVGKL
jgi:hypothetical protein